MSAAEAAEGGTRPRIEPALSEDLPGMLSLLEENGLPEDGLDTLVIGAGQGSVNSLGQEPRSISGTEDPRRRGPTR